MLQDHFFEPAKLGRPKGKGMTAKERMASEERKRARNRRSASRSRMVKRKEELERKKHLESLEKEKARLEGRVQGLEMAIDLATYERDLCMNFVQHYSVLVATKTNTVAPAMIGAKDFYTFMEGVQAALAAPPSPSRKRSFDCLEEDQALGSNSGDEI